MIYVLWWSAGRKTSTESPLNGPRTFQTIDTTDLTKACGGWEEGDWGNGANLLPFRKKWCEWPKSQFPLKVETANNSSWQLPMGTQLCFSPYKLESLGYLRECKNGVPPLYCLDHFQPYPQMQRSRHQSPFSRHEDGPQASPSQSRRIPP